MRTVVLFAAMVTVGVTGCSPMRTRAPEPTRGGPPPVAAPDGTLPAAELDRLIEESWAAAKVTPSPPADDGEYLRRVTLDLAGRVPSVDEAKAFLADRSRDKRSRTVDRLLASRDFAERWTDLYVTLFFGELRQKAEREFDPRGWLTQAFHENRPYDRLAREILTATGEGRDNGATAFIAARVRGDGGVEAVTGAAARVFLGMQIQCAQCHDHPYDTRWKQEDFYGLVAYFARTRAKGEKVESAAMMDASMEMAPGARPQKQPKRSYRLLDVKRGQAKMRRPGSEDDVVIQPRFLGAAYREVPTETRREAFARAVLASDLFAKTMVARTWAQLFGRGLVEPWDDLGGENDPRHPKLLVAVARDFAANGHDIKRLVRSLVLSTAYARSSTPAGGPDDRGAAVEVFARAGVRPLVPEQLFDMLVSATGVAEMGRRRNAGAVERKLRQGLREYTFIFGDDEMAEVNTFDGSVPQALVLFNGELTNSGARAGEGGVLGRILSSTRDPAARLDDLFLAVYTRRPSTDDRRELLAYLQAKGNARAAYEDLFFALLTSTEAITNH